ncbi:MAG TPA: homocysteine S-methyltransferase family protein [Anaerolineae bacterium]
MSPTLEELIARKKTILYDGATGTFLQELGLPMGTPPEKWVLDEPAWIFTAAEAYVNAGSQIILTCTFGGTAFRLVSAGLDAFAYEINRRAAELAKEAAGKRALVAGSIGPLGLLSMSLEGVGFDDAVEQFSAQARALADGGVDLIQIESMSDLDEVRAAVQGVRRVVDLPIFVTMTFDRGGKTLVGVTPLLAAQYLVQLNLAGFGANCGNGPEETAYFLHAMRTVAPHAVLIAKPNAGIPTVVRGKAVYSIDPERFAFHAREWVTAGARVIGGCCGTNPEYIRKLARLR